MRGRDVQCSPYLGVRDVTVWWALGRQRPPSLSNILFIKVESSCRMQRTLVLTPILCCFLHLHYGAHDSFMAPFIPLTRVTNVTVVIGNHGNHGNLVTTLLLKIQDTRTAHRKPSRQRAMSSGSLLSWRVMLNTARNGVHVN